MFVCHTPPFRGRRRRSISREWRTCGGPHGPHGNRRRAAGRVCVAEELFCAVEATEHELEDVGSEYCFRRAVPGIPPEQLQVAVQGPMLTVRTLAEVPGQRFEWKLLIPDDVHNECITAEIENGFLNVRLPKIPPRVIPVTGATSEPDLWKFENWGSEYRLTHPAPGVEPSDVMVKVEEGFLFVKVQCHNARFSREVSMPPAVDVDAIVVDIDNGLLIITLPKVERDEIRVHCRTGSAGPSTSSLLSEEDDILYNEARRQSL